MTFTIIGAGIAGLTTAIAIRKYRPDIDLEIYEASPELRAAGAGLALGANAVLAFDQLGIKQKVLAVSNIMEHFEILDAGGRPITRSNNLAIDRHLQTVSNFAVHRADLQEVLLAQIGDIPIHLDKKVMDFQQDKEGISIKFADGSVKWSDYVLAADGIHSVFRKKLLPDSKIRFAGYTCWRGITDHRPVNFPANGASETWGPGKRFGIVPLTKGRVYWFACLNALRPQDEQFAIFGKTELLDTFGKLHDPIARLISITAPEKILWNDIIDFPPVAKFAFDRVLLLGDAAHATTPNMGQGACQAIEGATILGKTLAGKVAPEMAFHTFEQKRLKRTALIVNRSWQLGKMAQLANPLAVRLRNTVFRLIPDKLNERQVKALLDVEF